MHTVGTGTSSMSPSSTAQENTAQPSCFCTEDFLFFVCPVVASFHKGCLFGVSSEVSTPHPVCVHLSLPPQPEHHRQLIQLLPEAGRLPAAAGVLPSSAETQVHVGPPPRPSRALQALRPLPAGPGETAACVCACTCVCVCVCFQNGCHVVSLPQAACS